MSIKNGLNPRISIFSLIPIPSFLDIHTTLPSQFVMLSGNFLSIAVFPFGLKYVFRYLQVKQLRPLLTQVLDPKAMFQERMI